MKQFATAALIGATYVSNLFTLSSSFSKLCFLTNRLKDVSTLRTPFRLSLKSNAILKKLLVLDSSVCSTIKEKFMELLSLKLLENLKRQNGLKWEESLSMETMPDLSFMELLTVCNTMDLKHLAPVSVVSLLLLSQTASMVHMVYLNQLTNLCSILTISLTLLEKLSGSI